MSENDLPRATYRLSNEVFALAQQAVDGTGEKAQREVKAREMNAWLDEHFAAIREASVRDPGLMKAWSDARLELGYILSGGELATSARLSQYIASRKQATH
jgi:hypothetical protein